MRVLRSRLPAPTVVSDAVRRSGAGGPDRYDSIGTAICLIGVAVIMYAPRTGA
jgi:hypothetical protein